MAMITVKIRICVTYKIKETLYFLKVRSACSLA